MGVDHTLLRLGWLTHHEGNNTEAASLLAQSLTIAEEAGFVPEAALALSLLGRLALERGETDRAFELLADGLLRGRQVQAHDATANCLEGLAKVALDRARPTNAARLLGAAERIREDAVRPLPPIEQSEYARVVDALREMLPDAELTAAWETGRAMTPEQLRIDV
jgi:hypothetical protein